MSQSAFGNLRVRARHTLQPAGGAATSYSVYCAARGQSMSIEECGACPHCDGCSLDAGDGRAVLRCNRPLEGAPRLTSSSRWRPQGAAGATPITDVMTPTAWCVPPELPVEGLVQLLIEHNLSGAPVVDGEGAPIGVVSKTDLLAHGREAAVTVEEIMTPIAFTLEERASLSQGAAMMAFEGIHRIAVVDQDGRVVGILSALDVARWVARQDGYVVP